MHNQEAEPRPTMTTRLVASAPAALVACCVLYRLWGRPLVARLYDQQGMSFFVVHDRIRAKATVDDCFSWGWRLLVVLTATMIAVTVLRYALENSATQWLQRVFPWVTFSRVFALVVAASLFLAFRQTAFEGPFYRVDDAMAFRADPPFRHRILFVAVAWAFKEAFGGLSQNQAFLLSQLTAAVLAAFAMQAWCRRVAPASLSYFGLTLMGVMLVPTFQYYTFYDFGIVFFFALCFTLLKSRNYAAYVAAAAVGTLNHEIILFMMLLSGCIARSHGMSWSRVVGFVLLQLSLYASIRGILFWSMPVDIAWLPGKFWINIDRLVHVDNLACTAVTMSWFAIAILTGFRSAPLELRWGVALLPMLIAMTLLMGQVNEARQFVAFVPVATGLFLAKFSAAEPEGHHRPG